MTDVELHFYLREIHSYWTAPRIASERVTELREAKMIECSTDAVMMVRLTGEGEKRKVASRQHRTSSSLPTKRKPESPRRGSRGGSGGGGGGGGGRSRGRRGRAALPRPLV